jgi:predicted enzyme involved in methoxymalonyl-ACP biosynthesis
VGVVIVNDGEIDTFLMSCRALGRKIEAGILHFVSGRASRPLKASYRRTAKNDMVSRFFDDNGFLPVSSSDDGKHYVLNEGPENVGHVRFVEY